MNAENVLYNESSNVWIIPQPSSDSNLPNSNPGVSHGTQANKRRPAEEDKGPSKNRSDLFVGHEQSILAQNSHLLEETTPLQGITLCLEELDFEEALGDTLDEDLALE